MKCKFCKPLPLKDGHPTTSSPPYKQILGAPLIVWRGRRGIYISLALESHVTSVHSDRCWRLYNSTQIAWWYLDTKIWSDRLQVTTQMHSVTQTTVACEYTTWIWAVLQHGEVTVKGRKCRKHESLLLMVFFNITYCILPLKGPTFLVSKCCEILFQNAEICQYRRLDVSTPSLFIW